MKKVIEQPNLRRKTKYSYNHEEPQWTWEIDEIAYCYHPDTSEIFKVKFTGNKKIGSKGEKQYYYKYLESSTPNSPKMRVWEEYFGNEDTFYTTRQEAVDEAILNIEEKEEKRIKWMQDALVEGKIRNEKQRDLFLKFAVADTEVIT